MQVKCYVVLTPDDRFIDVKLTRAAAHSVAKTWAPAKVKPALADKIGAEIEPELRAPSFAIPSRY